MTIFQSAPVQARERSWLDCTRLVRTHAGKVLAQKAEEEVRVCLMVWDDKKLSLLIGPPIQHGVPHILLHPKPMGHCGWLAHGL